MSVISIWLKKCVINLSIFLQMNKFLNNLRINRCVIKPLIDLFLYLTIHQSCFRRSFYIAYSHDRHKTQIMCDAPVDDVVALSKVISDSFVTSNVVKKLYTALYSDNNIVYFNENYGDVIFSCNKIGILSIDH